MKVGIIQQRNSSDVKANRQTLISRIKQLASQGAQLVVLPELHDSLYFCQVEDVNNFDLAEPIPGPSTDIYGRLAKETGLPVRMSRHPQDDTAIGLGAAAANDRLLSALIRSSAAEASGE